MLPLIKEMDCKSIYFGKMYSKWVTVVALFLSLITFSNNNVSSILFQHNPSFQTEWVYERRKAALSPVFRKTNRKPCASISHFLLRIFTLNRLLIVKLAKLAETHLSISTISCLFVRESISLYPIEADLLTN